MILAGNNFRCQAASHQSALSSSRSKPHYVNPATGARGNFLGHLGFNSGMRVKGKPCLISPRMLLPIRVLKKLTPTFTVPHALPLPVKDARAIHARESKFFSQFAFYFFTQKISCSTNGRTVKSSVLPCLNTVLCYVTLRYVTLCYVILCYVMLCYLCYESTFSIITSGATHANIPRDLRSSEHRSTRYTYAERLLHSPAKRLFCLRGKNEQLVASLRCHLIVSD